MKKSLKYDTIRLIIGKSWQHFAQVGVDEAWDSTGFKGFEPFYASTMEVSVGGDPTSLKVRNFQNPVMMGLGEKVAVFTENVF